jgi:phage gp36-like protein
MAYSTATEVRVVLAGFIDPLAGQDPDYTAAKLSDAQIEYEISNADEQINAVLRRRYSLPLPIPVPAILKNLSIDIAVAQADMIYRGSREYASELSPARLRYERAKAILDSIATGDYPLYNVDEGPEEVGDTAIVINPYKGDVLLTKEVFPRGYTPGNEDNGEYSEVIRAPYRPSWW